MMTNQENTWNHDTDQNQGYATNSFAASNQDIDESRLDGTEGGGNIPGSYSSNESMSGVNSVGDEDDDLATGDDIPEDDELEDDELEDEDYEDADMEEDTDLDGASAGSYTGTINSSLDDPNEMPEEGQSDNKGIGYSQQEEQDQPGEGADTSFSEQIDVTPPERHEFPSEGVATKTDFASRDLGRTTGRMLGHEPGTEGI